MQEKKICTRCKQPKFLVLEFGTKDSKGNGKRGPESRCKPCRVEVDRDRVKRDPVKHKAKCRRTNQRLKNTVFDHYGRVCDCCGEDDIRFLSIDHEDGKGAEHRKEAKCGSGTAFYAWLIRNGFPTGYKTLCISCNIAKGRLGRCPHEDFDVMTMIGACA